MHQIVWPRVWVLALTFLASWPVNQSHCLAAKKDVVSRSTIPVGDADHEQVSFINRAIENAWNEYELTPSAEATDGEWCRRVFLDVLGRIPSVQELQEFLSDSEPGAKPRLLDRLLFDSRYREDFTRNWTTIWTNILIGRNGGNGRRSLTNRDGMRDYLRDSFASEKPYDEFVKELIAAEGANTPGSPNFNGAVNFLTDKLAENGIQAAAQTSRIFLGRQVQCTQCHNHPFNEWKQRKFWELNSFFRQTVALRRYKPGTRDVRFVELTNQDFAGEGTPRTPETAEVYYELRNATLESAYPVFIDGTPISKSGYLEDVNRRTELADLVVKSDYFGEAIVNRMWAHFLGYGFTKPIDDMGPHIAPTHQGLLTYLANEFRESGYNLKRLMRWIALSRSYSLSSQISKNNKTDDPLLGERPKFSRFYLRQMRAEELYESLLVATEAHRTHDEDGEQESARRKWLEQFVIAFGTDEGDETTIFNGTIPQSLMMFNGELIKAATSDKKGSFLHRIAHGKLRPAEKIEYLYLAALARQPSRGEIEMANKLLAARRGESTAALQDMWWAILNCNEFILNH